jgi:hypothetical protein
VIVLATLSACATPEQREVGNLLDGVALARLRGDTDAQVDFLDRALARAATTPPDSALKARLQVEMTNLERSFAGKLLGDEPPPLVLEQRLKRAVRVLAMPSLKPTRAKAEAALARRARAACEQLTRPDTPYLRDLARRYCGHFGLVSPSALRMPETFGGVELTVDVVGAPSSASDGIRRAVEHGFATTGWFSTGAPMLAGARLDGKASATFATKSITAVVPWVERQAYSDMETVQQPYTTTEMQSEQVPYTTSETYSYPCGTGTCTGSRPRTDWRTEMRPHIVTRWQSVTRPVTRYRDVPREYSFPAMETSGSYLREVTVTLPLAPALPTALRVGGPDVLHDLTHDATFAPANLIPHRAHLPSLEERLPELMPTVERAVIEQLSKAWEERFCRSSQPGLEDAARCLRGAAQPPPTAARALTPILGADVTRLQSL